MSKLKTSVAVVAILFGAVAAGTVLAAGGHGGGRGGHGGGGGHGWHGGHGGHYHGGVRIGVGFGGAYWGGYPYYYAPYYGYGYAPYYPAYPAYPAAYPYAAPYAAGPAAYVEQAPPPGAAAPATGYWYYCNESQGYYPQVNQCAGPWQRVPPQPG